MKPGSNDSEIERRNSTICKKDQYLVTVKLTRQITGLNPIVTLERKDEHKNLYSLDKLYGEKVQACAGLIKKETAKNYSAAQIFHAIRGAGTEAGTSLFDAARGAFTKMHNSPGPPPPPPLRVSNKL